MIIPPAKRTESVKEYYFSIKNAQIAKMNAEEGKPSVINLGIGAPDGRPPQAAIDRLCEVAQMDGVHKYQSYIGSPELRGAFADWYSRFYNVQLDPSCEIQPLAGSKEGILTIMMAFINEGDGVLVPDPGYPTYQSAARLVGARLINYDLLEDNGFHPDFDQLESMDLTGVKMMWTNYPNMPTGGKASRELYAKIVDFGRRHGILICNDNPYSFILTDERLSILEVPGAKDCCLELNSLSKAHNMSGWRIGMVASNAEVIKQILKVKSQMDSGMFRAMQMAAVEALKSGEDWFRELNAEYKARRVAAGRIMDLIGARYNPDSTGLFLWGKVDENVEELSDRILRDARVFITPGFIFGHNGEHYMRISLCADLKTFEEAEKRIIESRK